MSSSYIHISEKVQDKWHKRTWPEASRASAKRVAAANTSSFRISRVHQTKQRLLTCTDTIMNEIVRVEKTGRVDFRAIIVVKEHNAGKHKDPERKLRK
jgi:hypothetical protein